jgi:hypothetical protein
VLYDKIAMPRNTLRIISCLTDQCCVVKFFDILRLMGNQNFFFFFFYGYEALDIYIYIRTEQAQPYKAFRKHFSVQ